MRDFVKKSLFFFGSLAIVLMAVNYQVDPANIYHHGNIPKIATALHEGKIVYSPGNLDEGRLLEACVKLMDESPKAVVIGSSHIMYEPWPFESVLVAGLSGAYLGDYYAVVGLLEEYDRLPQRVVIGVDPWSFMRAARDGRHTSLAKYAMDTYNKVKQSDIQESSAFSESDKLLELISIAYFQESCRTLRKNKWRIPPRSGIGGVIDFAADENMGERQKILPNFGRIAGKSEWKGIRKNDQDAQAVIRNGSVYQLGKGFENLQMENLEDFTELVRYLKGKGIGVDFYLHPWYPTVYDYFCNNPRFSGVLKTEAYIRDFAAEKDIVVHGSFSSKVCGVSESDYADWLHLKADKMLDAYNVVLGK